MVNHVQAVFGWDISLCLTVDYNKHPKNAVDRKKDPHKTTVSSFQSEKKSREREVLAKLAWSVLPEYALYVCYYQGDRRPPKMSCRVLWKQTI